MAKAEDRYRKLLVKTGWDGKLVYRPAIPISISEKPGDMEFIANERDRMDIIANNVFGSSTEWWRIAAANKKVDGSLHIKVGTRVIIPRE